MAESIQVTNTPNEDVPTISEAQIQASIVRWYNNTYCLAHHSPRHIIFSVPNGIFDIQLREDDGIPVGLLQKINTILKRILMIYGTRMKATGTLPGASDLIIVQPNRTLYVEVKTRTGRQSKEQIAFMRRVEALGHVYVLVRSLEEIKSFIESTL